MDVLLVERSNVLRERLTRVLEEIPEVHVVAAARTRSEAARTAVSLHPDAVVIDPSAELGGLELLREMRTLEPVPFVVVLTDDPSPTYCRRCLKDADLCLDMAHEIDALVSAIEARAVARDYPGAGNAGPLQSGGKGGEDALH